jgi:hypothetical protein
MLRTALNAAAALQAATASILTVHPVHWQPQQIPGELKAILHYNDTLLMPKTQRRWQLATATAAPACSMLGCSNTLHSLHSNTFCKQSPLAVTLVRSGPEAATLLPAQSASTSKHQRVQSSQQDRRDARVRPATQHTVDRQCHHPEPS